MSWREEWQAQIELAESLDEWLDPATTFWAAADPVASSRASGAPRWRRGVQPGVPDILVLYRGRFIAVELKSLDGRCNRAQRAARERILAAGGVWWGCKSAHAPMRALAQSGVRFREVIGRSGAVRSVSRP